MDYKRFIEKNLVKLISRNNFKKIFTENKIEFFREKLFFQNNLRVRSMPWLNEKNAYKIWLSEIILQQTTVAQGTPYYLKFTEKYPTVQDLAAAANDALYNASLKGLSRGRTNT